MTLAETKIAYADARRTTLVMVDVAHRDFAAGSDALVAALAKASAYMDARMDHIDSLIAGE
jgi:hypothetical protein